MTLTRLLPLLLLVSHPAQAVVVCPGPNAQYGIDVSEFQGNIDWNKVKAAGKTFAIIRVSDGTGHFDPYFAQNWSGAKAAGLIRGVYQFFEPGEDAVAQANLLLQHMGTIGSGDLPPMIDVEATGGQSASTINTKIHQWVDTIQKATGRKALVYTGGWFWNPDVKSGDFTSYPLVDSYYCSNCCPDIATPWSKWTMWQYSSTGSVGGISGNVDLDRFDGTADELLQLAGGSFDWSAAYVSQSWPLAATALEMTVNQSLPADIVLKNDGSKTWSGKTRLGTSEPRDRTSVFAAPDWMAPNRAAGCTAGAAPGATCKFSFNWSAPDKPGDYHEHFSLVDEGVAWFSDPGQGGPPDNQIEVWIHVSEADYHAAFVAQSYAATVQLTVGQEVVGWIDLKNVGTQTWKAGSTKLAPSPRDKPSVLAASDWLKDTRVSTLAADVAPGATGRFTLSLRGNTAGDYHQTFALVEEGVSWFSDAPKGGGPSDDALQLHVVVGDASSSTTTTTGGGGGGGRAEPAPVGAAPRDTSVHPPGAESGCSAGGGRPDGMMLVLLLALWLVRRSRLTRRA